MILDLILIILFQPIFNSFFFFLPPLLKDFFQEKLKKLNFKIILYTFLSDLLFIKPLGFFFFLVSFCFLILALLEKFIPPFPFYQKILFLFIFNSIFLSLFLLFNFKFIFLGFFFKLFFLNLFFQIIYLVIKNFLFR